MSLPAKALGLVYPPSFANTHWWLARTVAVWGKIMPFAEEAWRWRGTLASPQELIVSNMHLCLSPSEFCLQHFPAFCPFSAFSSNIRGGWRGPGSGLGGTPGPPTFFLCLDQSSWSTLMAVLSSRLEHKPGALNSPETLRETGLGSEAKSLRSVRLAPAPGCAHAQGGGHALLLLSPGKAATRSN